MWLLNKLQMDSTHSVCLSLSLSLSHAHIYTLTAVSPHFTSKQPDTLPSQLNCLVAALCEVTLVSAVCNTQTDSLWCQITNLLNGGSYTQHLQLLPKAMCIWMGRHIRWNITACIILLVILLTKKYPQMEILPARNLKKKKKNYSFHIQRNCTHTRE